MVAGFGVRTLMRRVAQAVRLVGLRARNGLLRVRPANRAHDRRQRHRLAAFETGSRR